MYEETPHGNYTWKETEAGRNFSTPCVFGPEDGVDMAVATRRCAGPHEWEEYYGGYCVTELTARLRMLTNVRYIILKAFCQYIGTKINVTVLLSHTHSRTILPHVVGHISYT